MRYSMYCLTSFDQMKNVMKMFWCAAKTRVKDQMMLKAKGMMSHI